MNRINTLELFFSRVLLLTLNRLTTNLGKHYFAFLGGGRLQKKNKNPSTLILFKRIEYQIILETEHHSQDFQDYV